MPEAPINRKVLVLAPYPAGSVPGQRFRYEQYLDNLTRAGLDIEVQSFLPSRVMAYLYQPGRRVGKALAVLEGFVRRLALMARLGRYDYVFVYREATPIGPPVVEWILFLAGKKVIYDFDDAIFMEKTSKYNTWVAGLKWPQKAAYIARHSYKVSVSNPYLREWAARLNHNVVILPTTIDPAYHRTTRQDRGRRPVPVIGWTGTHSTAGYLDLIRPALVALQKTVAFEFRVICDTDPGFPELDRYRFVRWQEATEIEDLDQFDIGLMPIPDGTWELGKAAFKAIQYSAMEIPPVVSPVGSGPEVVEHGRTGLVVGNTAEAWRFALETLIRKPDLIAEYGRAARVRVLATWSVPAQTPNYVRLFSQEIP